MKIVWLTGTLTLVLGFSVLAFARPTASPAPANESAASGADLFARHCAKCHGKDGRARGLKAKVAGTRNLGDPQWQESVSDERIFNSINNGKRRMPGFGKQLSEAKVDSLVQYVRSLRR